MYYASKDAIKIAWNVKQNKLSLGCNIVFRFLNLILENISACLFQNIKDMPKSQSNNQFHFHFSIFSTKVHNQVFKTYLIHFLNFFKRSLAKILRMQCSYSYHRTMFHVKDLDLKIETLIKSQVFK